MYLEFSTRIMQIAQGQYQKPVLDDNGNPMTDSAGNPVLETGSTEFLSLELKSGDKPLATITVSAVEHEELFDRLVPCFRKQGRTTITFS